MESKYRELLRQVKGSKDLTDSLYATNWTYFTPEEVEVEMTELEVSREESQQQEVSTSTVTEKVQILDSLSLFAKDKVEDKESFSFPGGEVLKKESASSIDVIAKSIDELVAAKKEQLAIGGDSVHIMTYEKKIASSPTVVFITDDVFVGYKEVGNEYQDLGLYFDADVSALFSRMIQAMKLDLDHILVSSIAMNETKFLDELLAELFLVRPKLVITLGATATHELLQSKERLKEIHGQFSKVQLKNENEEYEVTVMPLFSPKLLQTAPNMKKTAWNDMQKAMEFLASN